MTILRYIFLAEAKRRYTENRAVLVEFDQKEGKACVFHSLTILWSRFSFSLDALTKVVEWPCVESGSLGP